MQNIYLTKTHKWGKGLFLFLSIFLMGLAASRAQSSKIRVGPNILCLGQQSVFTFDLVNINPTDVQSYTIRFGNGDSAILNKPSTPGGPVTNAFNYVYKAPGKYTITGITKIKNGGPIYTSTWLDTVYSLPVVAYRTITLDSQCLANNFNGFQNLSVKNPVLPSNPLASAYWVFGDGNTLSDMHDTIFHRFALYGSFAVSLQVTDSLGCINSVAAASRKRVYIAPNVKAKFTVEGKASCNSSTYNFLNASNLAPDDVKSFKWYFDDDSVIVSSNPATQLEINTYLRNKFAYTYLKEGRFNPSLVIFDKRSVCSDSFCVSMDPSQTWPENIIVKIDLQARRLDPFDGATEFVGDSVCLNPDQAQIFLYNNYPLKGIGASDIHWWWNYNDPNQTQPPACYFNDVNPAPAYKYLSMGQYYPFLVLQCPNQPDDTFYYYSRIDTFADTKYSKFNQAGLAGVNVDWAVPPRLNTLYARHLNPIYSNGVNTGNIYKYGSLFNRIDTLDNTPLPTTYSPRYNYGKPPYQYAFSEDSLRFYYVPYDKLLPFRFFTEDSTDTKNHVNFKSPYTGADTTIWNTCVSGKYLYLNKVIKIDTVVRGPGDTLFNYLTRKDSISTFDNHCSVLPYNKLVGYGVNILGPSVSIPNPAPGPADTIQNKDLIYKGMQSQCRVDRPVWFTNRSSVYQSEHLYIKWDFGDQSWAPACTSYSTPQAYPPQSGSRVYKDAGSMENLSDGHFIYNGKAYDGRLNSCRWSHDTLPIHTYQNWDQLYGWHINGHDFPPYDTTRWTKKYTKWPTDSILPPGINWVAPDDTLTWNKPMFAGGVTRIDTMKMWPADLMPNTPITTNTIIPDPIAAANSYPFYRDNGKVVYYTIPGGTIIEPKKFVTITDPIDTLPNGNLRRYKGSQIIPGTKMSLYRYAFNRVITQCITAKLFMKDSSNNATEAVDSFIVDQLGTMRRKFPIKSKLTGLDSIYKFIDDTLLSRYDCEGTATTLLQFMKADAWGLGKNEGGFECPGVTLGDKTGVGFELLNAKAGKTAPLCGRTYLMFNYDSLMDRNDNTPCALDGFVPFGGVAAAAAPGGYAYPAYNSRGRFNPQTNWTSINGGGQTGVNWTHYQMPAGQFTHMGNLAAQRDGFITVGLIIGNGYDDLLGYRPDGTCLTDTIWYHNFIQILGLNATFDVLPYTKPTYTTKIDTLRDIFGAIIKINTTIVGDSTFFCSNILRGRGDTVVAIPRVPIQKFMKSDAWIWGDGIETVDSFYVTGEQTTPIPFARKRFTIDRQDTQNPKVHLDSVFEVGKRVRIELKIDTIWQCYDRQHRLPPLRIDTLKTYYDSAFFVGPIKHKYNLTSWEMKDASSTRPDKRRAELTPIQRIVYAQNGCPATYRRTVAIGIIDTFYVSDTLVCLGEEVQFVDYVRYWLPVPGSPCTYRPLTGCDTFPFQNSPCVIPSIRSFDDWRDAIRVYPDTFKTDPTLNLWIDPVTGLPRFYLKERIYWDYESDGVIDDKMVQVPKHKFTKAGKYKVSMITRDSAGYWDTCYRYIYVMEPRPRFTSKNNTLQFNCRDTVQLFDSSIAYPQTTGADSCVKADGSPCDQITDVFWWFGDRNKTPYNYQSIIRNPIYDYRQNGKFIVQLAVYSEQGCTDTITQEIFLNGPRPKIKLITDSVGCVPYSVKILSTPDADRREPKDTATQLTVIDSKGAGQQPRLLWSKPQEAILTYDMPGVYYITAYGVDNIDAGNASCPIIYVPDTFGGNQPPIRVYVVAPPEVKIQTSKQRMCVGEIFKIRNRSDFDSINRFTFDIWDSAYTRKIDSLLKTSFLGDSSFQYRFTERGTYNIVASSSRFIRSLGLTSPEAIASCERSDTVRVFTTSTKADFDSLSVGDGLYDLKNLSDKTLTDVYTWTIYNSDGSIMKPRAQGTQIVPIKTNPLVLQRADSFNLDLKGVDFSNEDGTFTVCLKASTLNPGCPDSICKTFKHVLKTNIKIPNVFTPGNDGLNDDFKIDITGYDKFELIIYNRWGTRVFESTDPNIKWNGKSFNDGAECAEGVYFYVLNYRFKGGTDQQTRGSVTLIR